MSALWSGERSPRGDWLWDSTLSGVAAMPISTKMLERIRQNPQAEYEAPFDVLDDLRLNHDQRQSVLESWELDARRLAEATAEGMAGGEDSHLREVAEARLALDEQDRRTVGKR
jgi:hypothetical protein